METTKITSKNQTTIPERVRKSIGARSGGSVEWHVVRSFAVVKSPQKMKNPVDFLTSQVKLDADAVRLSRQAREEFG